MGLEPGSVVGDYEIVAEIGRGGMAVVYEARQRKLNRAVALKVLPDFYATSEEAVVRFRREAEAGGRLQHPNIVQVIEVGRDEAIHFIAMELARGSSLAAVIDDTRKKRDAHLRPDTPNTPRRRLDAITATTDRLYIEWTVRTMIDVLRGIEHAHGKGVLHRDIKPQNLLLDEEGRVHIADFGLARLLEDPAFSRAGEFHGTPWYMSPEQVAVGSTSVDHRTDIFSAGITLYELLTLTRPFPGEDVTTVFKQILTRDPTPLRTINPRLPRDLETIVLKAMEKDPDRRYATAAEFADDLERFVNFRDILARPVGRAARLVRRASRQKALTAVSVGLVVVLVIVSIGAVRDTLYRKGRADEMLREADAFRRAGAFDLEEDRLQELLDYVDPGNAEAQGRRRAARQQRRDEADAAVARAERLLLERRYDRARVELEHALGMVRDDPRARELYEQAAGRRTVRIHVEGRCETVYASAYVQSRHSFDAPVDLGAPDEQGGVDAELVHGDYLLTATGPAFGEAWITVDPITVFREIRIRLVAGGEDGMVRIEAGRYPIGQDADWYAGSIPRHEVELAAFLIDAREATKGEYDVYLKELERLGQPLPAWWPPGWNKERELDPSQVDMPVALPWDEACRFLAFSGKRLPTEAEWEAACAGVAGRDYPWGDAFDATKANFGPGKRPRKSGSFGGEGYAHGLYDMIGNLWEWTADRYLPYPGYEPFDPLALGEAGKLPTGRANALRFADFDPFERVSRGGSSTFPREFATARFRVGLGPRVPAGVRGVRSVAPLTVK